MYSNKTNIQTILKSQVFKLVKCSDYRFGSSLTLMDRAKYGGWAAERGLRGGVHSLALEYQILLEKTTKKTQKCPNFNLGILKTEGGGGLYFSKMSQSQLFLQYFAILPL